MRTRARVCLICCLLFITAHRVPAPIVEEEKATPAPQQSEAPKRKRSTKSTSNEESSSNQPETKAKQGRAPAVRGTARFAGTWSGRVNQGWLGHVASSLTVDANATSVELSHNLGGFTRPVTINGNTISWKTGVAGEITWTLTPNSDGQTAQVTMKGVLLNDAATFRRAK